MIFPEDSVADAVGQLEPVFQSRFFDFLECPYPVFDSGECLLPSLIYAFDVKDRVEPSFWELPVASSGYFYRRGDHVRSITVAVEHVAHEARVRRVDLNKFEAMRGRQYLQLADYKTPVPDIVAKSVECSVIAFITWFDLQILDTDLGAFPVVN